MHAPRMPAQLTQGGVGGRVRDGVSQHELALPASQIMALFNKTVRKVNQVYRDILSAAIEVRALHKCARWRRRTCMA